MIVVDPRLTWMAARADLWIQPRPAVDSAVAMAMLKVIIEEDLYDHDFVDCWTYGFEALVERSREYDFDMPVSYTHLVTAKRDNVAIAHSHEPARVLGRKPTQSPFPRGHNRSFGYAVALVQHGVFVSQQFLDLSSVRYLQVRSGFVDDGALFEGFEQLVARCIVDEQQDVYKRQAKSSVALHSAAVARWNTSLMMLFGVIALLSLIHI